MAREPRLFEVVNEAGEAPYDDDVQAAFDKWRDGFEDAESPGHIRAFRIPLDDQGRASHSASGQIRLGTWPVDQYDFDALCDKVLREFMLPTEQMMAVRLIGTMSGKSGVRFNKIVTLQRPNILGAQPAAQQDGVTQVMRVMQEREERMLRMFQEMRGPAAGADTGGMDGMMKMVAMMTAMMQPMMGVMQAAMGRPAGAVADTGGLKGMIETMMMLDKYVGRRGGGGGGEDSGSDWVKITQAVSGVAGPLLQLATQNRQQPVAPRQRLARPAPTDLPTVVPQQPNPAPTLQPAPIQPVPPAGVDLSKPSPLARPSLSPGVNTEIPSSHLPPNGQGADMFAEMKKQVDALVDIARQGADPVAVANEFFDKQMLALKDEDDYARLADTIESDGFLNTIAIYNVGVKTFDGFFAAMREQLVKRIEEADSTGAE